jgi:uncharacterized protein YraI
METAMLRAKVCSNHSATISACCTCEETLNHLAFAGLEEAFYISTTLLSVRTGPGPA